MTRKRAAAPRSPRETAAQMSVGGSTTPSVGAPDVTRVETRRLAHGLVAYFLTHQQVAALDFGRAEVGWVKTDRQDGEAA